MLTACRRKPLYPDLFGSTISALSESSPATGLSALIMISQLCIRSVAAVPFAAASAPSGGSPRRQVL